MDSHFPLAQACLFLSAKDTLATLARVNKLCHSLTTADNLWGYFLERDLETQYIPDSGDVRGKYYCTHVKRHTVRVLNTRKGRYGTVYYPKQRVVEWKSVKNSPQFPFDPTLYRLSSGLILILGGERYLRPATDVFYLDESDMTIVKMPNLLVARMAGGVIEVDSIIYVFGGLAGADPISNCELFDPVTFGWCPLPSMTEPKAEIYPLKYKRKVYVSGVKSRAVELFDILRGDFEVLFMLDNTFSHFSFWYGGELIFMDSFGKYTCFDPRTKAVIFRENKEIRPERPLNTQLCLVSESVLYPSIERGGLLSLYQLDLRALRIKKVMTEDW